MAGEDHPVLKSAYNGKSVVLVSRNEGEPLPIALPDGHTIIGASTENDGVATAAVGSGGGVFETTSIIRAAPVTLASQAQLDFGAGGVVEFGAPDEYYLADGTYVEGLPAWLAAVAGVLTIIEAGTYLIAARSEGSSTVGCTANYVTFGVNQSGPIALADVATIPVASGSIDVAVGVHALVKVFPEDPNYAVSVTYAANTGILGTAGTLRPNVSITKLS